jgi:D-serine deaminase-like pyridoxal phosphate-dependent protein
MSAPASLLELETPCLVADRERIVANAARMRERAARFGFELRPHLKTAKSADIAKIAHGGDVGPITVATLREADYFLRNGFTDITYAVAVTPNKFARAAHLMNDGLDLKLLLSDSGVAFQLVVFASEHGCDIDVMLEIDSGEHRTGFLPESPDLVDTAALVAESENLNLTGLLTHGGHSYRCRTHKEIAAVAEQERLSLLAAQKLLAEHSIRLGVLSSGSTPTALHGENFEGITEMRPGVYLAGDLFQAQLGTCKLDDIAVSVLSTVVAQDRGQNRLIIDAGGLALSKDRSTRKSPVDYGYGLLTRADGTRFEADLIVTGVHQEHGEVRSESPIPFEDLAPGSFVRVLPNHACMTAAAYDRYHVVAGDDLAIIDTWPKTSGW